MTKGHIGEAISQLFGAYGYSESQKCLLLFCSGEGSATRNGDSISWKDIVVVLARVVSNSIEPICTMSGSGKRTSLNPTNLNVATALGPLLESGKVFVLNLKSNQLSLLQLPLIQELLTICDRIPSCFEIAKWAPKNYPLKFNYFKDQANMLEFQKDLCFKTNKSRSNFSELAIKISGKECIAIDEALIYHKDLKPKKNYSSFREENWVCIVPSLKLKKGKVFIHFKLDGKNISIQVML
jgi:hypothetical protein